MADMTGTTQKQKWLERETLKVHDAIERNLDSYLKRVDRNYQHAYDTLIKEVKRLQRDLELGRITNDYMELRTNVLISQLENRVREINLAVAKEMPKKLSEYGNYSREGMEKILSKINTVSLPVSAFEFASGFRYENYAFQSSFAGREVKIGQRLNKILSEGLAKGWDARKYTKELQAVSKFTKFEANRIARTESARVATEGSRRTMQEYGIERVEWNASLERRTCPVCASLHGKKYRMGNEPPLPRHPFCRCVLLPVIDW